MIMQQLGLKVVVLPAYTAPGGVANHLNNNELNSNGQL
jgi:hypothetical protein